MHKNKDRRDKRMGTVGAAATDEHCCLARYNISAARSLLLAISLKVFWISIWNFHTIFSTYFTCEICQKPNIDFFKSTHSATPLISSYEIWGLCLFLSLLPIFIITSFSFLLLWNFDWMCLSVLITDLFDSSNLLVFLFSLSWDSD